MSPPPRAEQKTKPDADRALMRRFKWLARAGLLSEVLPYMQRHAGHVFVVKIGGAALKDKKLARRCAEDLVLLGQIGLRLIIVHGGGAQISAMLERLSIDSDRQGGLRRTTEKALDVVEMVLSGRVNQDLVSCIHDAGGRAVGLSGRDGGMVVARQIDEKKLGLVGEPCQVDPSVLNTLLDAGFMPVIAPIASRREEAQLSPANHQRHAQIALNVNADSFAGALAVELKASRLLLLTDVDGVLDENRQLIPQLDMRSARRAISSKRADGGMIPKLQTCIDAVSGGVDAAVILNGSTRHALLLELFTDIGAGTLIKR